MDIPDKSQYTPMMQQYLTIKEDYNDAIVFFRLGDFYEMFFTDAYIASRELEIQLTGRDAGSAERVPMCGVPHHAADAYIERLIQKGYKVAICEQIEDPATATKLVERDVVRLITPGTYIERKSDDSQYLATIGIHTSAYTIAYADLATGDTYALTLPKDKNILIGELLQIGPKELLVASHLDAEHLEDYRTSEGVLISIESDTTIPAVFESLHKDLPSKDLIKTFRRLLAYIVRTQKRQLMHLKEVTLLSASSYLKMDANTIKNLELQETLRSGNRIGSLFWLIDKCATAMGSRALKQQLLRPLVNKDVLLTRYDTIDCLNREFIHKAELGQLLKDVYDLERIVGRVSYGNTNGRDLVQLRRSLAILPAFQTTLRSLEDARTTHLADQLDLLEDLTRTLQDAIVDDPPLSIKEGGVIRTGYHEPLDEIRQSALANKGWLDDLQERERERIGIKKLKIGYNRVFGYYIEVPKGQVEHIKDHHGYIRKQTLVNSERYITEALKDKETLILSSEEKSVQLEYDLFLTLRDMVRDQIPAIQNNARILSEVDVLLSLSKVSEELDLVRPTLVEDTAIEITDSRHPVVETVLQNDVFVPNDIVMNAHTDILLITGPNMSGKSTYMRQMAITAILAQIGSFVPAKQAKLPVFDAIYTRIGAADDLVSGKSTFMVEMLDANHALQHATERSLILFDEIGRGTATYDGMALARAIIEYIHEKVHAKTMFSTHYHELTDLDQSLAKLRNVHVSAKDQDGAILFLHKVKEGPTDKSYGIHVASLAQMPKGLIERAKQLLVELEASHGTLVDHSSVNLFNFDDYDELDSAPTIQDDLRELLDGVDIDEITPLEALNLLARILPKI